MAKNKKLYKCSCGYATHFEKALEAHCRFRHHEPLVEEATAETAEKKTRKPRTQKAVKE